jgi:hypothetical protein
MSRRMCRVRDVGQFVEAGAGRGAFSRVVPRSRASYRGSWFVFDFDVRVRGDFDLI